MTVPWVLLLLSHVAVTWLLVGLIWTVQVVHYPLFNGVGPEGFVMYQRRHMRSITWIVGPAMGWEVVSTFLLLLGAGRAFPMIPLWLLWLGAATVVVNWLATWLAAVPIHNKLMHGFDAPTHRRLVRVNGVRTAVWSLHGLVSLAMLFAVLTS